MMDVFKKLSGKITKIEEKNGAVYFENARYKARLIPVLDNVLRLTVTKHDSFPADDEEIFENLSVIPPMKVDATAAEVIARANGIEARIDLESGSLQYFTPDGKCFLRDDSKESYELEEFTSMKLSGYGVRKVSVATADGNKDVIKSADYEEDKKLFHVKYNFVLNEDEAVFGFGQQEKGPMNLRGRKIYIHQGNRQIAMPVMVLSSGSGVIFNCGSPMIFDDSEEGTYVYSEAASASDIFVVAGTEMPEVTKAYRKLTGKAALLPKWAFGYIQSQERYESQDEIIKIAKEFRKKEIGVDCLVLDWLSWNPDRWGQKTVDKKRFPKLKDMTDTLHDMNIKFMISIWPNPDDGSLDHAEFVEKKALLPGSNVYDAFSAKGRDLYWKQLCRELVPGGVDAWWCDSSEPFTPEWVHSKRMLPEKFYSEYCSEISKNIPAEKTNEYSYYHAKGIYDGQRSMLKTRVCNLTRSSFLGQQKFGTIMWSGDIGASWQSMREQIKQGLNYSVSGIPFWTFDIGAFFIKTGEAWHWDGQYPEAANDPAYRELYARWYQLGAMMPVFRAHGTDARREPWEFNKAHDGVYDALLKANKLRYQLIPYIYTAAALACIEDGSVIWSLAQKFPKDLAAVKIEDEYMLGDSILVCPVVEPMYYDENGKLPEGDKFKKVYLPKGTDWYDYYTGERYRGGSWTQIHSALDKIPLFVKAGSIIPVTDGGQYADDYDSITLRVYTGEKTEGYIYEDDGNSYDYENGQYIIRRFSFEDGEIKTDYPSGDAFLIFETDVKNIEIF